MKTKLQLLLVLLPCCFLLQSQVSINAPKNNSEIIEKPIVANAVADQVIPDDLIVQGSLCVGFDCVNNESFGFDTQRLKENNLQIHFEDTSVGSFPTNDWRIKINDSASGGASYFAVEDASANTRPLTISAGAGNNALFINNNGNVGFGTASPVLDLHAASGNTPALRFEQNGSSGFTPQTWDVAGNEANFFVRDVTNGSKLPFRIFPNSPTSSIEIKSGGVNIKNVALLDPTTPSDKRLKKEMVAIADATSLLVNIVPKTFYFNEKAIKSYGFSKEKQYGLIAQEVESVIPELIRNVTFGEDKTKYKSVRYDSFISILIQGFKEQQEKIDKQSDEIKELKTQIAKYSDLEKRMTAMENSQKSSAINKTSK